MAKMTGVELNYWQKVARVRIRWSFSAIEIIVDEV